MATIRKRGQKWQAQLRRKGCPHLGRSFSRKSDALVWARRMEEVADRRGLYHDPRLLDKLTVADLLTRYRNEVVPAKKGRANEEIMLNAFLRHPLAKTPLSSVTPKMFANYRDERLRNVKPATVNRELGVFQHAFNIACREWDFPIQQNPVAAIQKVPNTRSRDRRLKDGEWERLVIGFQRCRNKFIKPLVHLALETGMRRGELLKACWSDVNWEASTLHIPHTKTGHPRTIPLSPGAFTILSELKDSRGTKERIIPLTIESASLPGSDSFGGSISTICTSTIFATKLSAGSLNWACQCPRWR